ncbi:tRNA (adenosine(37)-N6)-threonylcarbamoyltransferase complex dimerization subunit type 1 TsaB [Paenibacillus sp. GCM10023252]|uniref:tRNA (adenosine(37)-N6)-threonylcarbamoyltransferase complex dimerization subunit type 1 TsaB n=1 Tax=Paenibacillus sp. GCM10023252 TaxID=3252649 RepID=UPI00360D8FA2
MSNLMDDYSQIQAHIEEGRSEADVILALDTSTAAMAAAIVRGAEVLGEVQSLAERNHSVHVIEHVSDLIGGSGLSQDEISLIAVGSGPGSYTGMRIAASAAKTLAWVWGIPLVSVSSLEGLAYGAWRTAAQPQSAEPQSAMQQSTISQSAKPQSAKPHSPTLSAQAQLNQPQQADPASITAATHWVVPIMDARRGQVYTSLFLAGADGSWTRVERDGVRLMSDWIAALAEKAAAHNVSSITITGDIALHEEQALRLHQLVAAEVRLQPYIMEGRWLAALGAREAAEGGGIDPHAFVPNYTQLTEAEVNLKARGAGHI